MQLRTAGLWAALLALPGCAVLTAGAVDPTAVEPQIRRFYEARAFERNAMCPTPFITSISRIEEVSDDGRLVVLRADFAWDIRLRNSRFDANCRGFGSRLFTFERVGDQLQVREMSGEQRGRPAG